jgi:hypothetical protein
MMSRQYNFVRFDNPDRNGIQYTAPARFLNRSKVDPVPYSWGAAYAAHSSIDIHPIPQGGITDGK